MRYWYDDLTGRAHMTDKDVAVSSHNTLRPISAREYFHVLEGGTLPIVNLSGSRNGGSMTEHDELLLKIQALEKLADLGLTVISNSKPLESLNAQRREQYWINMQQYLDKYHELK